MELLCHFTSFLCLSDIFGISVSTGVWYFCVLLHWLMFIPMLRRVFANHVYHAYTKHNFKIALLLFTLTAHNWQELKRVFLTRPCHKIFRLEAVGLKSSKHT